MKRLLTAIIKGYRKAIKPYMPKSCRFSPTCSEYALEALDKYGAARGSLKAARRILRCNPFSRGGYDPLIKEKQRNS
jgi:uncharacterized protein